MYQLHNLINCTFVPSDPSNNMIATEDFYCYLCIHIVAAAKALQSVNPVSSVSDIVNALAVNVVH